MIYAAPDSLRHTGLCEMKLAKHAIVVLGMHRSGTSSMSGSAAIFGAALPKDIMNIADAWNPRGYFESNKIVKFNDRILASIGSRWNDWREIPNDWLESDIAHEARTTALELLAAEYDGSPLIVMKDPRICRLLPFWRQVLDEAGYRRSFLLPYRNPFEVADSLKKRDGFSRAEGLLLWLRHALESEHATRHQPRDFVFWPDFLQDPATALKRSAERIGFTWPRITDFSQAELDQFVSSDLRRNKSATVRKGQGGEWVSAVFQAFRQLEAEPGSNAALVTLDNIRAELHRAGQLFGPIHADFEQRSGHLETTRADAEARLKEVSSELERLRADATARADAVQAELASQAEVLRHATDEAAARVHAIEAERDYFAAELGRALGEREALVAEQNLLTGERDHLSAEIGRAGEVRDALAAERDRLSAERDHLSVEFGRAAEVRDALAAERDRLAAERNQIAVELGRIEGERDALAAERLRLAVGHDDLSAEMSQLRRALEEKDGEAVRLAAEVVTLEELRDSVVPGLRAFRDEGAATISRLEAINAELSETISRSVTARVRRFLKRLSRP